jgi:hypothetical protein
MRVEFLHFVEILTASLLLFIGVGYLNKISSFKGKSSLSLKRLLGNNLFFVTKPKNYYTDVLVFLFIAIVSSFLILAEGKIYQVVLLFSVADLVINQKHTSLAHLSNTLLICVFVGLNNVAPVSLLLVQLIFFVFYAINTGKELKLISVASQMIFFLSCLNSFNFSIEYLLITKATLFISFPFLYLLVLHFIRSTPALKTYKLDNIMWVLVILGSLKGVV